MLSKSEGIWITDELVMNLKHLSNIYHILHYSNQLISIRRNSYLNECMYAGTGLFCKQNICEPSEAMLTKVSPAMMWIYKTSNQYEADFNLFMLKPLLNSHGNVDVRFYPFACRGKKSSWLLKHCHLFKNDTKSYRTNKH